MAPLRRGPSRAANLVSPRFHQLLLSGVDELFGGGQDRLDAGIVEWLIGREAEPCLNRLVDVHKNQYGRIGRDVVGLRSFAFRAIEQERGVLELQILAEFADLFDLQRLGHVLCEVALERQKRHEGMESIVAVFADFLVEGLHQLCQCGVILR